jgi:uncharacterized protein involved in oxidation of intracellular sulfur
VFPMGDAVGCAMANQQVPTGYYHLDRMIESAAHHGAEAERAGRGQRTGLTASREMLCTP